MEANSKPIVCIGLPVGHKCRRSLKATIKKILANEKYNDLMKFSDKGVRVTIKYLGTDEAIDEVVFYGYKNDRGLMLGRVLGEDMNLKKAYQLVSAVRAANIDAGAVEQFQEMFDDH